MKNYCTPLLLLLLAGTLSAQTYSTLDISDPDPDTPCSFGNSVALYGDHLFVTETCYGIGMSSKVHVFHRNAGGPNSWGAIQLIISPDGDDNGFGTGLKVKDGVLAIGRPQHSFDSLGVTLCRGGSIFFYSLSELDVWELASTAGGASVENENCSAQAPIAIEFSDSAAGIGHFYGVTMFNSLNGSDWEQVLFLPATLQAQIAINGDRLFAATGEYTITEFDINGAALGPITTDLILYGGAHQLKVLGEDLVLSQPGGQFVDYTQGRLLLLDIESGSTSILDEFSHPGTSFLGETIATAGGRVAALEGHYHEPLGNRIFLLNEANGSVDLDIILDGIAEEVYTYERRLDLSPTGDVIYSTVTGSDMMRTVRLYLRDLNVGLASTSAIDEPRPVIEGELLRLTNVGDLWNERVSIFSSTGALAGETSVAVLSGAGYDMADLAPGIYCGMITGQQKRFKFIVR